MSAIRGSPGPTACRASLLHLNCAVTFKSHNTSRFAAICEHQIFLELPNLCRAATAHREDTTRRSKSQDSLLTGREHPSLLGGTRSPGCDSQLGRDCDSALVLLVRRPRTPPHAVAQDPKDSLGASITVRHLVRLALEIVRCISIPLSRLFVAGPVNLCI